MAPKVGFLLLKEGHPDFTELIEAFKRLLRVIGDYEPPDEPPEPPPPTGRGHIPTRIENGRIWTPVGFPPRELDDAIRRHWPREVWTDAAHVSWYESSWSPTAALDTRWRANGRCGVRYWFSDEVGWATTEYSIGYFQINSCAHGHDFNHWKDADNNADKGADLYRADGWRPWRVTATRLGLL